MKKLVLIIALTVGTLTVDAQISRPNTDSKVSEFTKLVHSYTGGQRVDKARLLSIYNEINCMLTETQSEALNINLENTREDICGSSEFPRTQSLSDATFKKYAEQVKQYNDFKSKVGDK